MFKIEKPTDIKWPVTISIPRDGGRVTKATCTVRFKLIPQEENSAIYADGGNDEDLLRRVLVGWEPDVADEDGNPLEFSEEVRDKLIGISYVRAGIVAGYLDCSSGKAAGRKN